MKWYFIQVQSGKELQALNLLQSKIAEENYQELFGRMLIPTEKIIEMKSGKETTSERKIFSGYLLIEMSLSDTIWYFIRHTNHVYGFVGGAKPYPLTNKEVEKIFSKMEESKDKPTPKFVFEVGENVRVTKGAFADFSGVVEEVNYGKNKLKVSVVVFGRSTPLELDFNQIIKN